jgi:hypothetical protein
MTTISHRVKQHRDALRRAGLRPVQIWVPDIRRAGFAEECRRQALKLAGNPLERETMDWIDALRDTEGWR